MKTILEIVSAIVVLVVVAKAFLTLGYCCGWADLQVKVGEKLSQYKREGRSSAVELSYEINQILSGIARRDAK
jgi:hypothetical protein